MRFAWIAAAAWGLAACAPSSPDCLDGLCVGSYLDASSPPELAHYRLSGGICDGQTILSSRGKLPGCKVSNATGVAYRNDVYHVVFALTEGEIESISRQWLDIYP